jgi:hypothetical protein
LGDAIPQKYPFFFFFRGFAAKKEEKTGLGLPPQSHETVTLTPMGCNPPEQEKSLVGGWCGKAVPPTHQTYKENRFRWQNTKRRNAK